MDFLDSIIAFFNGKLTATLSKESSFLSTLSILAAQAAQVIPSIESVRGLPSFDNCVSMIIKQCF